MSSTSCLKCGKSFMQSNGKGAKRKFCSVACRISYASHSHVCEQCGESFTSRYPNSRFCSRQCVQDHERADPSNPPLEKNFHVCEQCSKRFYKPADRRKNYRFCSNNCRLEYDKQNAKVHQTLTCQICGKEIGTGDNTRSKFCSLTCRREYRRRQGKHAPQTAKCKYCDKEFESIWQGRWHRHQQFCSKQCGDTWRHANGTYFPGKLTSGHVTNIERLVANELGKRGIPYAFEYSVPPYWLDFLLAGKVVIECDGVICSKKLHIHCEHMHWRDECKNQFLTGNGYTVYRWNDTQITSEVIELVSNLLEKQPGVVYPTAEEREYLTGIQCQDVLSVPVRKLQSRRKSQNQHRRKCKRKVFARKLLLGEDSILQAEADEGIGVFKLYASIILMSANGVEVESIAEKYNCDPGTVRRVIKLFNQAGPRALCSRL